MVLPMSVYHSAEHCKRLGVCSQLAERLDALGTVLVHDRIVVSVVNHDNVVLVLDDKLCSLRVDLLDGVVDEIIHLSLKEDSRHTAMVLCDNSNALACSYQSVKEGVYLDDGLRVLLNSVNGRLSARVEGAEAYGGNRGHYGAEGHLKLCPLLSLNAKLGVLLVNPLRDSVGIEHKHSVGGSSLELLFCIIDEQLVGLVCLCGTLNAHYLCKSGAKRVK